MPPNSLPKRCSLCIKTKSRRLFQRYLRTADGRSRRKPVIEDRDGGGRGWGKAVVRVERYRMGRRAMLPHRLRRPRLVLAHEAGVADDVGGEDRGEAAGGGHCSGTPALRMPVAFGLSVAPGNCSGRWTSAGNGRSLLIAVAPGETGSTVLAVSKPTLKDLGTTKTQRRL